ncbi:MAG: PEP/pyruvate-binding domain-containing protein [Christensenellales bacterium]|jgi:pyruvate,water dikinase
MDAREMRTLAERAKELECVYAVDRALQDARLTLPEMMAQLAQIIPSGFSCPAAARVRITLWADAYETPGFEGADEILSAPISMEGEVVGALAAAYRAELLAEPCPLLPYERKMIDTIARRISQLALSRQRELTLLISVLRQLDPDMLITIAEKLGVYLEHTFGRAADSIVRHLGAFGGLRHGEENAPSAAPGIDIQPLANHLIEAAVSFLSQETVFRLFHEWIYEQRVLALVKIVDRKDSRVSDILEAVRKYIATPQTGGAGAQSQTETWLLSELTHRFLSDDERLINLVLNDMRIADFAPMIERIIGSERSMGRIGGKGAGLFIASQILRRAAKHDPLLQGIHTPRTWYIATDHILDFLRYNNLEELNSYKYNSAMYHRLTYENVVAKIRGASLPPQTVNMLRIVIEDFGDAPLIVRSSSLLEDKYAATFSGKYKSLFLANNGSAKERLDALTAALLEVYASMYNPDSLQYRRERGLIHFTEQMGVMIQEVVGARIGKYRMPLYAGVAFSRNLLRWSPRIRPEDGLIRLVMGLGTRAVDRLNNDYPLMLAPGQPQLRINQSADEIARYAPRQIDLIDPEAGFTTVDAQRFLRGAAREFPNLHQYVSVLRDDFLETKNAFTLDPARDEMVITLHHAIAPQSDFIPKIRRMLEVLSEKLECAVDIEFACDGERLYLLQCRPQGLGLMNAPAPIPQNLLQRDVLFTATRYVPDGMISGLQYLVYVDPGGYHALSRREELLAVGEAVGLLNEALPRRKFALIGPGRWGSRGDIKLGVRVSYADISNAAALIEVAAAQYGYAPELSFGTHFFQDLVEGGIVYLPLYPQSPGVVFKEGFFHAGANRLASFLPQYAHLAGVLKVIEVAEASGGRTLSIHMNSEIERAAAFFTGEEANADARAADAWRSWAIGTQREHWQWRHYMAQEIASSMDMEGLGVKGVYLIGSTAAGNPGMGSDIDLILHVEEGARRAEIALWLEGWSLALARINFLQTGHDARRMLDVHYVTDADVARGDLFAARIGSVVDPATVLRVRGV